MNINQLKAQIEAASAEAYERGRREGTEIAVNKARSMMPTIVANAHKQGVMDAAGFFKLLSARGESALDLEDAADKAMATGEVPEVEKKTPGGIPWPGAPELVAVSGIKTVNMDWSATHNGFAPLFKREAPYDTENPEPERCISPHPLVDCSKLNS